MKKTRRIGKICIKHPELLGERYSPNSKCIKCSGENAAKWRKENPEKVRKCQLVYAGKNPDRGQRLGVWKVANQEKALSAVLKWRKENSEKVKVTQSKWQKANPDKMRAAAARRKAKKLQATPAWANKFFIEEAYHLAKLREKVCGGKWHVDHIVPLVSPVVCGLHVERNLCVIPGKDNMKKGNRYWPDMP